MPTPSLTFPQSVQLEQNRHLCIRMATPDGRCCHPSTSTPGSLPVTHNSLWGHGSRSLSLPEVQHVKPGSQSAPSGAPNRTLRCWRPRLVSTSFRKAWKSLHKYAFFYSPIPFTAPFKKQDVNNVRCILFKCKVVSVYNLKVLS